MKTSFEEIIIDEIVRLHIKLYFPKISEEKYEDDLDGATERFKDEVKLDYLNELIKMNKNIDSNRITKETFTKVKREVNNFRKQKMY